MKHWVKQNTPIPDAGGPPPEETPSVSDISSQRLIDKCLIALDREVRNLLVLSAAGKLKADHARDLRDHLKLLFEIKKQEQDSLAGLTDEELKAKALEDAAK